ncbi:secretin and TonB N-terminal domain-containing protein [Pseudomonas sp. R2.Fl]|nr:secretin and TonB N-terminal domain-containing protein [Pseudomonas sp. R2.Fl]
MAAATASLAQGRVAPCDVQEEPVPERSASSCAGGEFDFDIGPQSLDRAIEAFGDATGQSVIYDSSLTAGVVSPGVRGRSSAIDALARILQGSGLRTRQVGQGALVLTRDPEAPTVPARDPAWYYGEIQHRLGEAFCRRSELAEGRHRLALQLWFAADGTVARSRLLESTGDVAVDAAVRDAMDGLALGAPVPAQVAQPFTLLVLPRAAGYGWACPAPGTRP